MPPTARRITALIAFLIITFAAPALAAFFPMPGAWYQALQKPSWNPPAWLFGPVWTVLYILMAVGAWMVWKRAGWSLPVGLYFIQLALNAAWTPLFFGYHLIGWALVEILALWLAVFATFIAFRRVHCPAGWCLIPYLAWASFAAFLNYTLWRLNSMP